MRRLLIPLLVAAAATLAGCGQKGPLVLPPAKPQVVHPAPAASAAPAGASSARVPLPAAAASSGA